MIDSTFAWFETIDRDILFATNEIWLKPIIYICTDTLVVKFAWEDFMVDRLEGILKVNKDASCYFFYYQEPLLFVQ